MRNWQKHYVLAVGIHAFEAALIALTVIAIQAVKPAYSAADLLLIIAVGMIAGGIYIKGIDWITVSNSKEAENP